MKWSVNAISLTKQPPPENPYFRKAYDFLKSWQSGQDTFSLQTSGSTGKPQIIDVTRQQLSSSAAMTGKMLQLNAGTKALVCLNVAYVAGLMMLVRGMELNWELTIVEPSGNPLSGLDDNFDFIAMVPVQLDACLQDMLTAEKVDRTGKILLGGAPVSAALQDKILFMNVLVYQSYGMTETVSHVALRKLNPSPEKYYSFLPEVEYGVDSRGCLFVSGPMTNYKVVQTNDLVGIGPNATFIWQGRFDNVINSGGVKIVLDKIDEIIAKVFFDSGYAAAFFSWYQQDEKLGQKLILIVEEKEENMNVPNLIREIRNQVSAYETPKHVYFVDRFAKTPTDKIDKRHTAAMLFKITNG